MTTSPESADEDIRLLDELSGLGMAMSRDLQGRCLAVGDAGEAAQLALAFQRASRSVRQTIALKARLLRDRTRHDREDQAHAVRETEARILIRKAQVRLSVERAVWNEADGPEAERLLDEFDDLLEAETFNDGFVQGPVDIHIARLCQELGVTPPESARESFSSAPPPCGEGPGVGVHAPSPQRAAKQTAPLPTLSPSSPNGGGLPQGRKGPEPKALVGGEGLDADQPLYRSSA